MGHPTSFSFNCTLPAQGINFVRSPPVRGTLDIVWGCLGVLILSVWGIWDFDDISKDIDPPAVTLVEKIESWAQDFSHELMVMALALMLPEVVTGIIISDHFVAHMVYKGGLGLAKQDNVEWTMSKAYYANQRGFQLEYDPSKFKPSTASDSDLSGPAISISNTAGSAYSRSGYTGLAVEEQQDYERIVMDGKQMLYLRKIGVINTLPTISAYELNDRSKSNSLVQIITLVEYCWLLIQIIARHVEKLFITQLEVVTLAFAVLSAIGRCTDWHRPKKVRTAVVLYATRRMTTIEQREFEDALVQDEIVEANSYDERVQFTFVTTSALVGLIFGGLHCLAWNEDFPTHIEQLLWRIAAVITAVFPLSWPIGAKYENNKPVFTIVMVVCGTYALARLYIIVETVRSLFYQSPDSFKATWTANFPHIG